MFNGFLLGAELFRAFGLLIHKEKDAFGHIN